jgi:dTDP-4-amino-4,6-dideoxygalactose transaminase
MDRIMTVADRHGLLVIEDAAQAVNSFYKDRPAGAIGHLATYSFHETKNYTCGEGGALCINHPRWIARAEIIRDKGTNRQQYFRGAVDKYTWVEVGSSYVPSEINSAFLYAQLEMLESIAERRRRIYEFYSRELQPLEDEGLLKRPEVPEVCRSNFHMFHIRLPDVATRDSLMHFLRRQEILAVFHYVPLHSSPMGRKFGYRPEDLPVTEDVSGRLLRLPFFYEITEEDQRRVTEQIGFHLRSRGKAAAGSPRRSKRSESHIFPVTG